MQTCEWYKYTKLTTLNEIIANRELILKQKLPVKIYRISVNGCFGAIHYYSAFSNKCDRLINLRIMHFITLRKFLCKNYENHIRSLQKLTFLLCLLTLLLKTDFLWIIRIYKSSNFKFSLTLVSYDVRSTIR